MPGTRPLPDVGGSPSTPKTPIAPIEPGRPRGTLPSEWNEAFREAEVLIRPWLDANPDNREMREMIFAYGSVENYDEMIDRLIQGSMTGKYVLPGEAKIARGGSRSRGGGSGGGGGGDRTQQYEAAKAALRNRARSLGKPMDDGALTALAKQVVDGNWSNDMVDDHLLADPGTITDPGLITVGIDQIKAMGAAQLLRVSDETAREYAIRIQSGEMDPDTVRSIMATQASLQHGWAAEQIKQGITVRDMLLPARDMIANELEVSPNEIDLMDPKWLSMTQTTDEKTGATRAATLSEVTTRARKDERFATTANARRTAAGGAQMLRQIFEG